MKFSELPDKLKHTCVSFVEQSDVVLKIRREDLAVMLSELLENAHEGTDDICVFPLKYNADCSKGVPNSKRVYFTIDDKVRNGK